MAIRLHRAVQARCWDWTMSRQIEAVTTGGSGGAAPALPAGRSGGLPRTAVGQQRRSVSEPFTLFRSAWISSSCSRVFSPAARILCSSAAAASGLRVD